MAGTSNPFSSTGGPTGGDGGGMSPWTKGGIALGGALLSGHLNKKGAEEQAEGQRDAARIANRPFRQKEPFLNSVFDQGGQAAQRVQSGTREGTPQLDSQISSVQQQIEGIESGTFFENIDSRMNELRSRKKRLEQENFGNLEEQSFAERQAEQGRIENELAQLEARKKRLHNKGMIDEQALDSERQALEQRLSELKNEKSLISEDVIGQVDRPRSIDQAIQAEETLADLLMRTGFGQGTQRMGQELLSPDALDPSQNPFLQAQIDASTQPVIEKFNESVLPRISNNAVDAGQFGSSRQGVIEANAADDLSQNLANRVGEIIGDERERQMEAPRVLQKAAQLQLMPASILEGAGQLDLSTNQTVQQLESGEVRNEVQRQFAGLNNLANILGTGPNSIQSPGVPPSPTQSAISGATGGAATSLGIIKALNDADDGE